MAESQELGERLLTQTLDAQRDEYKELSEVWRTLDVKAQGSIAVAGIFLAGMLAFVRELTQTADSIARLILAGTTVFLMVSVALSLAVLWPRSVQAPPLGDDVDDLVKDLLGARDGLSPHRIQNYYRDQAQSWRAVNADVNSVNGTKANLLVAAQICLVLAMVSGAVVTIMRIWK